MSCGCDNRRKSQELDRQRGLAKKLAMMEDEAVAIYLNEDGTYGFDVVSKEIDKKIIEYVTQY